MINNTGSKTLPLQRENPNSKTHISLRPSRLDNSKLRAHVRQKKLLSRKIMKVALAWNMMLHGEIDRKKCRGAIWASSDDVDIPFGFRSRTAFPLEDSLKDVVSHKSAMGQKATFALGSQSRVSQPFCIIIIVIPNVISYFIFFYNNAVSWGSFYGIFSGGKDYGSGIFSSYIGFYERKDEAIR